MERNTRTTVKKLKLGDRFYKLGDKKKKAMQLVEGHVKATQFQTYKYFCCPADLMDNKLMTIDLKKRQFVAILKDTEVIFLRSVSENQASA